MKYNDNGEYKDIYVKAFDTLPIGTEVDYDGQTVPAGWTQVDDEPIYSTTERRCGTWINGKPLYSKTIETTSPVVSTDGTNVYKDVSIDESNIDYVFVDKAFLWATGVIYNVCGDVANMSGNLRIRLEANMTNKNIRVYSNNSGYSNSNLIIVVNYTKTTD